LKETYWDEAFHALEEFVDKNGNCKVPDGFILKGFNLGNWVRTQRLQKANLTKKQFIRLEKMQFIWELSDPWDDAYKKLEIYKNNYKNLLVPKGYKIDDFNLYDWVVKQRMHYRRGSLSKNKIRKFNFLNFVWDPKEEEWDLMYNHLLQFQKREGHVRVPDKYQKDGFSLGTWVGRQRKKMSSLSAPKIERLNLIGFVWDPYKVNWEEGFSKLKIYHSREGHCAVPQRHQEAGYKLGAWVSNQRMKKHKYPNDLRQKLDELGFIWDASKDKT